MKIQARTLTSEKEIAAKVASAVNIEESDPRLKTYIFIIC